MHKISNSIYQEFEERKRHGDVPNTHPEHYHNYNLREKLPYNWNFCSSSLKKECEN